MISHPHRNTFLTTHHILPKVRCSSPKKMNLPSNKLRLWRDRHSAFHYMFFNFTLNEIVYDMNYYWYKHKDTKHWKLLFRDLPLLQIVRLLERTIKIKSSLKSRL